MSTIVYQGLQSCLETQLAEPRALTLKLSCASDFKAKEKSSTGYLGDSKSPASNPNLGSWDFIQALSNTSSKNPNEPKEENRDNSYLHPLHKLSPSSLELCTENLGSETGTDTHEDSIFSFSSSDSECGNSPTREPRKVRLFSSSMKSCSRKFPPPLTTISGSNSLHVRPHREDGRLIIKAVKNPSAPTCFEADRSDGRLRLCFTREYISNFHSGITSSVEEYEGSNEDEEEEFENEVEEDGSDNEVEEDENESEMYTNEGMDGHKMNVGDQMGMRMFQRTRRCKEGGQGNKEGLLKLEPFWVAIS